MRRWAFIFGVLLTLFAGQAFAQTRIFLTSGTTWTVPQDFNITNTIEIVGSGAAGGQNCVGITSNGGGGGAYAKINNVILTPGSVVNINFSGESGTFGGSGVSALTWFVSSATVAAEAGWDGGDCTNAGFGGRATASVGTTKFSGGKGGLGVGGGTSTGPGGGAAGLNGAGVAGFNSDSMGGAGDAGFGGTGGGAGGGGDCVAGTPNGGNGTEWDASHGSGGGGCSGPTGISGVGGLYGGGGGFNSAGKGGLIVITYTPRNRVSSGVF